jgi:hypothetical protein
VTASGANAVETRTVTVSPVDAVIGPPRHWMSDWAMLFGRSVVTRSASGRAEAYASEAGVSLLALLTADAARSKQARNAATRTATSAR